MIVLQILDELFIEMNQLKMGGHTTFLLKNMNKNENKEKIDYLGAPKATPIIYNI